MSEMSDADMIRNKRLAKLGSRSTAANGATTSKSDSKPSTDATPFAADGQPASGTEASKLDSKPATDAVPSAAEAQPASGSEGGPAATEQQPSVAEPQSTSDVVPETELEPATNGAPKINITPRPSTPSGRERDRGLKRASPHSTPRPRTPVGTDEHRILSGIFRITLNPNELRDAHENKLHYVPGVRADLEAEGAPLRLTTSILDQAILEAASNLKGVKPLDYLLECWKRVSRQFRGMRGDKADGRYQVLKEARRLCMSYCIFAVTMPDMFGQESLDANPLAEHLLVDPENDRGICHDFLSEAVSRFQEDESIRDALVDAMFQLSTKLSKMSMNDDHKPYVLALRNFVRYPPLVDAITKHPMFLPSNIHAQEIEVATFLGPFFRLSPLQGEVAVNYFSGLKTRDKGYIVNSQRALRMTLSTHQTDLLDIANCIIKAAKEPRERMLDWFAMTVNLNHKRRAMQVDPKTTSSDGFMINVTVCLDGLCEPFMDTTFSKIDRIDVNYLRRSPRISIQDETKINADQQTSDRFYSQKLEGTNNFISEVFFLAVAAHHYGSEATNAKVKQLRRHVDFMEREIERLEAERPKYATDAFRTRQFEAALKKFKDDVEKTHCVMLSIQGVLLDEIVQARSMLFMRYVIVWMLRLVQPSYPQKEIQLPLPQEQPDAFRCLPEYFLEDVVDNFKFITRNMPQIISSTQCDELVTLCITFLESSEYIKNPYLKSGLVTILFSGVWPQWNRSKGVLGDVLNSSPFALKHLLHSLMKFFIEAEFTGTHGQFYDKFNIRYEIFQIIRCIWGNHIYRENLAAEAKHNLDFFVRFVNLLLNDVTFVLDESFTSFQKIHELGIELRKPETLTEQEKQEKEEALEAAKGKAKSYMQLTNETVSMLKLFTEALADSFTMPEIVDRLAAMLNYNLDALAGPKQSNLRVENPQEYNFNPKQLISDIVDVYLNLGSKPSFQLAVVRDGRSYKPANFAQASHILSKFALKSPAEIATWDTLAATFQKVKEADDQAEEDLGEIPDEFLDPLLATLMEDPVILPTSRQVVDRSTIRSHLLSDPNDPFNRTPLRIEDVVPATELKERIQAFKREKKGKRVAEAMEAIDSMDTSQG